MQRILLFILVLLFCINLSLGAKTKAEKQLQANLHNWEQFRWQGMVQVKHEALTLRKFYVISKNSEALRLDILDSGIMGLNARPMVALFIKDRIVLDAPTVKQLEGVDPNWFITPDKYKPFFTMSTKLLSSSDEIIANRKVTRDGISYIFDKKCRLTGINIPKIQISAQVVYNRKSQPDKVIFNYQGMETAIFTIDEITYNDIHITPLESSRPEFPDSGQDSGGDAE